MVQFDLFQTYTNAYELAAYGVMGFVEKGHS